LADAYGANTVLAAFDRSGAAKSNISDPLALVELVKMYLPMTQGFNVEKIT
jgi:hypothetical protein